MGTPPSSNATDRLVAELDTLHLAARRPGGKRIAQIVKSQGGSLSHTAVIRCLRQPNHARWSTLRLVVLALNGDEAEYRQLWENATGQNADDLAVKDRASSTRGSAYSSDGQSSPRVGIDSEALVSLIAALENSHQAIVILGETIVIKYAGRLLVREVSMETSESIRSDEMLSADPIKLLRFLGESDEYSDLSSVSPHINWSELGPVQFERLVARLLHMEFESSRVEPVDGAGGDGGVDIAVYGKNGEQYIYECKSFSQRLTASQRRQVENSLSKAAILSPRSWILVAPMNFSPAEWRWFENLRKQYEFTMEFRGVAWLEVLLARHPEVVRSVDSLREQIVEAAGRLHQEQAVLASGASDLLKRVDRLRRAGEKISSSYDLVPFQDPDGTIGVSVVQKVVDVPPEDRIEISASLSFPKTPEGRASQSELIEALDFGGSFEIPPEFVERVKVTGPPELGISEEVENVRLTAGAATPDNVAFPRLGVMRARQNDGSVVALPVEIKYPTFGRRGWSIYGATHDDLLSFTVRLSEQKNTAELSTKLTKWTGEAYPQQLLPILNWRVAQAAGSDFELQIGDLPTLRWPGVRDENYEDLERMSSFVAKLARLQEAVGPIFAVPTNWTNLDEQELGKVDALLSGNLVELGNATLPFEIPPGRLRIASEQMPEEGFQLAVTSKYNTELCNVKIKIPDVTFYCPNMRLVNRQEMSEQLLEDSGAGFSAIVESVSPILGQRIAEHAAVSDEADHVAGDDESAK